MNQKFTISAGILLIVAIVITACGDRQADTSSRELVYGLTLVPSGIDPHIHASAELGIPLRSVYDTLVYRDADSLEFTPGLAQKWTISDDGLTYTFDLRNDVQFHDGTHFDAEAVRINLERMLNPENNSFKARFLLGPVASITVLDVYRIAITLSAPFAPLLDGLSQPYTGIASPKALSEWDTTTYQFHQVGTGPYRFVEYVVNDRLVLERNEEYAWGPEVVSNRLNPTIDRIVFRFFTDPASRSLALESGDVDVMGELMPLDAQRLVADGEISLAEVAIPGQPQQFMFNVNRAPTSSLEVRKALILSADRQAITQAVYSAYSPVANGPLNSSTLYYSSEVEALYTYDPVQAVQLMDSTGWVDTDGDGWRDDGAQPLSLNIIIPPWGLTPEVALVLESQWETTLGIQVTLEQVASFPMLVEAASAGEYNAISLNFQGLDPSVLNGFFLSDASRNWTGYASAELDGLLLEAQSENDEDLRKALYEAVQLHIMENALILPVREIVNLNGAQPDLLGLRFDAQGWFPYLTDITRQQ